jgi:acyl-CoA synthetase (AMP-forming)/AMP-acid ligase II
MKTEGPAISFLTSCWLFPQNEQYKVLSLEFDFLSAMNAFLADKVAKWWLPDDLVVVDEIPHTATGKILKTKLRETFKDHRPKG